MLELIAIPMSALMFLGFIFDLVFRKNTSLTFALVSNPYVSGLIMYFNLFSHYLTNKKKKFNIRVNSLVFFLLALIAVISTYYVKNVETRTVIQLAQFFLLLLAVCFIVLPSDNYVEDPKSKAKSLIFSTILLCVIKFLAVAAGIDAYNINGQNEDSFLIVIVGCICAFLFFERLNATFFAYFLIVFLGLIFYESRAAQGMIVVSLFAYIIAAMSGFRLIRLITFFVVVLLVIIAIFANSDVVKLLIETNTDLERNHSNIERVSMYLFTFDYLMSAAPSYGLGNLDAAMDDMRRAAVISGEYPHPHSSYLRFALEFGWPGFIGLCMFYIFLLVKSLHLYKVAPKCAVVLIIATFNIIVFSFVGCIFFSFYRASAVVLTLSLIMSATRYEVLQRYKESIKNLE